MSEREEAYQLLDTVPDNKISYVIGYMQGLTAEKSDKPNSETIAAMQELESGNGTVFKGSAHEFISTMLEE